MYTIHWRINIRLNTAEQRTHAVGQKKLCKNSTQLKENRQKESKKSRLTQKNGNIQKEKG